VAENLVNRPLREVRLVLKGAVYELGTLAPQEKKTFNLAAGTGVPLQSFVIQHGSQFQQAVQERRNPLGRETGRTLENLPLTAMAASFVEQLGGTPDEQRHFIAPPGLDLTRLVERGDAVLFAWDSGYSYSEPLNRFQPPRLQRNTLLRLAIPVETATKEVAEGI
jgi:hypothetical protein